MTDNHEPALRAHRPLHGDRDTSHTLVTDVDEGRDVVREERGRGLTRSHNDGVPGETQGEGENVS